MPAPTLGFARIRRSPPVRARRGVPPAVQNGAGEQRTGADIAQVWDLLALFDDASMTEKEKTAVLTLLAYLRRRAQQHQGGRE